jgi:Mg-chelatase subunit ChlD
MLKSRSRCLAAALPALLSLPLLAAGCGGSDYSTPSRRASGPSGPLTLTVSSDPAVTYDAARGRTTAVLQFAARGSDGVPLSSEDVAVEMQVDGQAIDNESILQASSVALASSLHYGLVLDASGSMVQHTPPAFGPMKTAARTSVEAGAGLWQNRSGSFTWDVCWFNDYLFYRQGDWRPEDLESLPDPEQNAATKLYAAVDFMARKMGEAGVAEGPRDHRVMVVLSDGADNLSGFDNAAVAPASGTTVSGARFDRFGYKATTRDDALASVRAVPNLTVHVLAMGSQFKPEDVDGLKQLAQAGGGQFLENPSSSGIAQLFERVTKEFTTLQTIGAAMPQQSGDHVFKLVVKGRTFSGQASHEFRYRAGPDAQILP